MPMSLEQRVDALEAEVAAMKATIAAIGSAKVAPPLPVVNIDGQYGDPEVRKDPPRWVKDGGETCVGYRYSQCPPDFLDSLAGFLEWKAGKNDAEGKDKWAGYDRLDAARARAWAARKREDASRYGTTGHGASAKHTAPRDEDEMPDWLRDA